MVAVVVALGIAAYHGLGTQAERKANYLHQLAVQQPSTLMHGARITDSHVGSEGEAWDSTSAVLLAPATELIYDLGSARALGCLWLQADNNDLYRVFGSNDGLAYFPIWDALPVTGAGLRLRYTERQSQARYLMLRPEGGDRHFSVSEFGAAADCPQHQPLGLKRNFSPLRLLRAVDRLLLLTAALIVFALWLPAAAPSWGRMLTRGVAGGAVALSAWSLYQGFPFFSVEPALRAALALVGMGLGLHALLRESTAQQQRAHTALLAGVALLALGCYYHFGALQFHDVGKGRQTFVHTFDMRHYFPQAKYFPELRFDGLYLASLAAYEDETGITASQLSGAQLRDLSTNEVRRAPEVVDQLEHIRARFTPARWQEFRRDMRYFMDTMGRDYLGSMQDHGGNATPVWVLGAWLLFRSLPASEWTISLAGLIDPVLLLLLFACIARSFGLRSMLYCVILFGATDFYQFGSNLVGSTLRQDWLVALGLGACALKAGRHLLGGGLLAYAGLVRAFPAMATFFLAVPVGWWILDQLRLRNSLSWTRLWAEQQPALRTGLAAFVTVCVLVFASAATFGWNNSWGAWFEKIRIHAVGPSVNNVGLRNLMSYDPRLASRHVLVPDHPEPWVNWQRTQMETYAARRPLTYLLLLGTLLLAVFAARGQPLYQVPILGLLTIPFLFYLSNYYCHFIFLLPLAFIGRLQHWGFVVLAGLCVGQYFSLLEHWSDERYTYQSMLLLAAFWLILLPAAWRGWQAWRVQSMR